MSKFSNFNFDSHIAFNEYPKVGKTCQYLFQNSPIHYFVFQRLFRDDTFSFLFSDLALANYFFKYNVEALQYMWQFSTPHEQFENGFLIWDIAKSYNTEEQDQVSLLFAEYNLKHGIDIVEKNIGYTDLYTFASNSAELYHYPLSKLRQFIFYFKQECQKQLRQAVNEKFHIPVEKNINAIPIFKTSINNDKNKIFNLNKYYLRDEYENIYLTNQEICCLDQLSQGLTAKETAYVLKLSYRTVEYYMARLKDKLGCSHLTEVISIVNKNNIF